MAMAQKNKEKGIKGAKPVRLSKHTSKIRYTNSRCVEGQELQMDLNTCLHRCTLKTKQTQECTEVQNMCKGNVWSSMHSFIECSKLNTPILLKEIFVILMHGFRNLQNSEDRRGK